MTDGSYRRRLGTGFVRPDRVTPAPLGPPVQLCSVDGCFEPPAWRVFAAYPTVDLHGTQSAHPTLARYPASIFKACPEHLSMLMLADGQASGSTDGYYVEPIRAPR